MSNKITKKQLNNLLKLEQEKIKEIFRELDKIIDNVDDDLHFNHITDLTTVDMYTDRLQEGISRTELGIKALKQKYLGVEKLPYEVLQKRGTIKERHPESIETTCKNCGHKISQTKERQRLWLHNIDRSLQLNIDRSLQLKYEHLHKPISVCGCGCINPQPA